MSLPSFEDIAENLSVLEDWEDRYRYVIDLGKSLPPFPDTLRREEFRVQGCTSQVWVVTRKGDGADPVLSFEADSDALIVKGLVAIVLALNAGRPASEIAATDTLAAFDTLGLKAHLSAQRSNGLKSMIARIRSDAERALAG